MKLPSDIKDLVRRGCYHSKKARECNDGIREWMKENDLSNGMNIDQLIDVMEMGYGTAKELIAYLEGDPKVGNEED